MQRDQILGLCALSALTLLVGINITIVLVAERLSSQLLRTRQAFGWGRATR